MEKIYCFNNGGSVGLLSAIAIAEDGHVLAGHCCSSEYFMQHDLGITSTWKHDGYDKHYGAGNWELEWIIDPLTHEGLQKSFELNRLLEAEEQQEKEDE